MRDFGEYLRAYWAYVSSNLGWGKALMIALVWLAGMFAPLARAQSALLGYVAGEERGVVVGHGPVLACFAHLSPRRPSPAGCEIRVVIDLRCSATLRDIE
jgi:hypothetical protein